MSAASHIASVVVRTPPALAHDFAGRIATREDSEVYAIADGKIVVVLEADSEHALADRMDEMRREPGVLFVNLVFHQEDA